MSSPTESMDKMEAEDKRTNTEVLIEHLANTHIPLDTTRDFSEIDWRDAFDAIRMYRARWNGRQ